MPNVASIGTDLPRWSAPRYRVPGSRQTLNPSGGLYVKRHPDGASGVAQCVELFAHLRGEAANQTDDARIDLAYNIGGSTAVSDVTILDGSR